MKNLCDVALLPLRDLDNRRWQNSHQYMNYYIDKKLLSTEKGNSSSKVIAL